MHLLIHAFVLILLDIAESSFSNFRGVTSGGNVSVSGISSGGFFSVQFHVGFSSKIVGAGIIAGGPYYCSEGNVDTALAVCKNPSLISVSALVAETAYAARLGSIDDPAYLRQSRIWLFSGTLDTVVNPGVMKKLQDYYLNYVSPSQITTVFNISAEHAMITDSYGNSCSVLDPPFINDCDYDAAGQLLSWIYNRALKPPARMNTSNIIELDQAGFVPPSCPFPPKEIGLFGSAYAYVPSSCQSGGCSLHVAFHGCQQTIADINDTFYMHSGYNIWVHNSVNLCRVRLTQL